jgi:hypothetical protein
VLRARCCLRRVGDTSTSAYLSRDRSRTHAWAIPSVEPTPTISRMEKGFGLLAFGFGLWAFGFGLWAFGFPKPGPGRSASSPVLRLVYSETVVYSEAVGCPLRLLSYGTAQALRRYDVSRGLAMAPLRHDSARSLAGVLTCSPVAQRESATAGCVSVCLRESATAGCVSARECNGRVCLCERVLRQGVSLRESATAGCVSV